MSIFKNLENSELFAILECNSLKEIVELLATEELAEEVVGVGNINEALIPRNKAVKAKLLEYSRRHYAAKLEPNAISGALFFSLNDIASFSILTLLTLIGNVTLPYLALSIVTGGFSAASIVFSALFFTAFYLRQKKSIRETQKFFDFATLKSKCAEKLIKRQKLELAHIIETKNLPNTPANQARLHPKSEFVYKNKDRYLHVTDALAASILTGAMLFGTYYFGLASILTAFGAVAASAALTGPIGLPIAGAIVLGMAIFCFVMTYKSVVNADHIEKLQEHTGEEFEKSRADCYSLHRKIDELAKIEEHDMPARKASRANSDPSIYRRKTFPNAMESVAHTNFFMMQRGNRMRQRVAPKNLKNDQASAGPKF